MSLRIEKGRDIQLTHKGASGSIESLDDGLFEGKKKGEQVTGCEVAFRFSQSSSPVERTLCLHDEVLWSIGDIRENSGGKGFLRQQRITKSEVPSQKYLQTKIEIRGYKLCSVFL